MFNRRVLPTTSRALKSLTFASAGAAATATMASAAAPSYQIKPYTPPSPPPAPFPYSVQDFQRMDAQPDTTFYDSPRFVTHIDDGAIEGLAEYYQHNLPTKGRVLDFCSSWISHFPAKLQKAAEAPGELEVIGMGLNEAELAKNTVLKKRIVQDLNDSPELPAAIEDGSLDAATCVVSIDYLTSPVEVLSSLKRKMREEGRVHLAISNRCFPTKAVGRWLRIGEEERLRMVGDYLWWAGWKNVEIVTVKDGSGGGWFGMGGDPLWIVRAIKQDE